jgi:3',5'-cyclic AMP phosphodiesterase CpdA
MAKVPFYILTDTHYVSKKTWVEGKPFTVRERSDQIALSISPEILDAFLEKVIDDKDTGTVVFLGDNVNNCDMLSHYEFRERLETLTKAGKNVFVIYATHDYSGIGEDNNIFEGYRYTETDYEPIESMKKKGLFDFYYDYGPKQALSIHENSGSYTVRLGEGLRLISIIDNGDGGGYCGLDEEGTDWLVSEIRRGKSDGDIVLVAAHHPVIPPWDVYGYVVPHELYGGYKRLCEILLEEGVKVIFTGHTHVQSIKEYACDGKSFFDVSTSALVGAAGKMRKVTVDTESGKAEIKSMGIDKIDGVDTPDETLHDYIYHLNFPGILEKLVPLAVTDYRAFLEMTDGCIKSDFLTKHKRLIRFTGKRFLKMKLSTVAKLGNAWKKLTEDEKTEAKGKMLSDTVYTAFRHLFAGNAPFNPDTVEYKSATAFLGRVDCLVNLLGIKAVKSVIPHGSSLRKLADDFLYNNRTGNDDEITVGLK